MCSAGAKLVQSRHRPSGPRDKPMGSQSDSPGPTQSAGIARTRLESGSKTRRSSWNALAPLLAMLTAEAAGETSSAAVTPSGSLPAAGLGMAEGVTAAELVRSEEHTSELQSL